MPTTFYGGGEGTNGRRTAAGLLGAVALVTAILGIVNVADVPTFEGLDVAKGQAVSAQGKFAAQPTAGAYNSVIKVDFKFKLGSVDITPYDANGQIGTKPQNVKYKAFRAEEIAGVTPKPQDTSGDYKDTIWEHEECHWKSGDKKARKNLFHTWLGFMRLITSLLLILAGAIGCYQAYGYWTKDTNTDVTSNSTNTYILVAMIFIGALAFVHGAHHGKAVDCIANSYEIVAKDIVDDDEEDKFKMPGTLYYAAGALSVLTGVLGIYVHRHDEM